VFRVGETLEAFLDQPLASLASRARVVDLMHARGIHTLRFRSTAPAAPAPLDDAHVEDGSAHDHAGVDPHIWLDPDNAAAMVRAIRDTLQAMDPDNAAGYIANAEQTLARLTVLDRQWQEQLAPFRSRPFIVFHEAYRYLESHFGLASAGSVTPSPQQPPGARRVAELRRQLRDFGVGCVFREPQFRAAIIETLVDGTAARVGVLDAIGLDISPGADAWFEMMGNNVAELVACLREDP